MANESELPAVLCDRATMGALTGPGDSVQLVFSSPITADGAVGSLPVFRAAMTRLAFTEFVDALVAFRDQLSELDTEAIKRSN